ncbi:MAG: Mur ligase family protein [Coprobacillaceae bacterium]
MKENYSLERYLEILNENDLVVDTNIQDINQIVKYLSCNSKDVETGTLFICKGLHFKEQFLKDAMKQGSICYVSDKKYDIEAPCIIVKDIRIAMAYLSDLFYHSSWKNLNLVGITGTKGKSTTSYFVKYILDAYLESLKKQKSGIISTIHTFDGKTEYESHITTPESIDLHKLFQTAVTHNVEYMEMEVSSQALKYNRVLGVTFDIGVFLNIGYDHISDVEHENFQDYFQSKLLLFKQCKKAFVNLNTDHLEEVLEASKACSNVKTFGVDTPDADIYGYEVKKKNREIHFMVKTKNYTKEFCISMPGLFNVQNALAAIAICDALNIPQEFIYNGLKSARVSGRMEVYESNDQNVVGIVDYAHNGLSFEKLFQSVKEEYSGYHISIVFGCPGDKAYDRRKDLGEIAGKYADTIYLTEDDPGEEEVIDICHEIGGHIEGQNNTYTIILDREEAIEKAILETQGKTVVLVAGKGNDNSQRRGRQYVEMPTDSEYTMRALKKYNER